MEDKQLGQTAYEAYRDRAAGRSLASGEPLPAWEQLNADIREAWQVAALAVIEALAAPGPVGNGGLSALRRSGLVRSPGAPPAAVH